MGKVAWKGAEYAANEFVSHFASRIGALFGVERNSVSRAAARVGVTPQTLRNHIDAKFSSTSISQMQAYYQVLKLDPVFILKLIGVSQKDAKAALEKLST